jgi:predicted ATPase
VQAVLAARIDRLPPDDKQLLQSAAAIGKDVPFTLLETISDLSEDALRLSLGRLQATEFLYETCLFPDLEYNATPIYRTCWSSAPDSPEARRAADWSPGL